MINLPNNDAKKRYHAYLLRNTVLFENKMTQKIRPVMERQVLDATKLIENGITDITTLTQTDRYTQLLIDNYIKIGMWYFKEANNAIEANTPKMFGGYLNIKQEVDIDDFMEQYQPWLFNEAAEKITKINNTTRDLIRVALKRSLEDGLTYVQAAKKIREAMKISNVHRSVRIARTELHTASQEATQTTMEQAPIKIKMKEWSTAADERVRHEPFSHVLAEGEIVKLVEYFVMTGEQLKYPGDSFGSAGNVVNCRCISLYNT